MVRPTRKKETPCSQCRALASPGLNSFFYLLFLSDFPPVPFASAKHPFFSPWRSWTDTRPLAVRFFASRWRLFFLPSCEDLPSFLVEILSAIGFVFRACSLFSMYPEGSFRLGDSSSLCRITSPPLHSSMANAFSFYRWRCQKLWVLGFTVSPLPLRLFSRNERSSPSPFMLATSFLLEDSFSAKRRCFSSPLR